eukprot:9294662-Alexandrium_andersonii.AAC.1
MEWSCTSGFLWFSRHFQSRRRQAQVVPMPHTCPKCNRWCFWYRYSGCGNPQCENFKPEAGKRQRSDIGDID